REEFLKASGRVQAVGFRQIVLVQGVFGRVWRGGYLDGLGTFFATGVNRGDFRAGRIQGNDNGHGLFRLLGSWEGVPYSWVGCSPFFLAVVQEVNKRVDARLLHIRVCLNIPLCVEFRAGISPFLRTELQV